jgi:enoyl-CoA hydratase
MSIIFEQIASVGVITLDRIKALNSLSKEMIEAIYQHLQHWKQDHSIAAVLIRSASDELFCAGGDVRSVYEMRDMPLDKKLVFFKKEYRMIHLLNHYPKPIISLMNGITMGGGVGLGMHVAFPIAGQDMIFAMPETMIGLFPDVAGSALLNRLPRAWQNYLGVFSQRMRAPQLLKFGLVYGMIDTQNWPNLQESLFDMRWNGDGFKQVETLLAAYLNSSSPKAIEDPVEQFHLFDTSSFYQLMENIQSSANDALHVIQTLISKLCPLSMIVTFEQLKLAQNFNVTQALQLDFRILQHFLELPELYEGVRAMLIDKDKHPHWYYPDWQSVPYSVIQKILYSTNIKSLAFPSA